MCTSYLLLWKKDWTHWKMWKIIVIIYITIDDDDEPERVETSKQIQSSQTINKDVRPTISKKSQVSINKDDESTKKMQSSEIKKSAASKSRLLFSDDDDDDEPEPVETFKKIQSSQIV